jgi:hypothetical protein
MTATPDEWEDALEMENARLKLDNKCLRLALEVVMRQRDLLRGMAGWLSNERASEPPTRSTGAG